MIGDAFHSERASALLIARARARTVAPWWREPARQRLGAPAGVPVHDVAADFRPFDLAEPFGFSRAPARSSRSSSARSSASGSSRATTTSGRSSRTRRRSRRRTRRRPTSRARRRSRRSSTTASSRAYSGPLARASPPTTPACGASSRRRSRRAASPCSSRRSSRSPTRMLDEIDDSARRSTSSSSLTYELPALVIFRLLGVPDEDVADVKRWAASRVALTFGDLSIEEQMEHAHNLVRYWRYCLELVQSRFDDPRDDLPVRPRPHLPGGRPLALDRGDGAASSTRSSPPGHETTSSLLAGGLKDLLIAARALGGHLRRPRARPGGRRGDAAHRRRRCSPGGA